MRSVEEKSWLPADPAKLKANWDELEDSCGIESTVLEDVQTEILVVGPLVVGQFHKLTHYPLVKM